MIQKQLGNGNAQGLEYYGLPAKSYGVSLNVKF
jgi:hypothetical protein